MLFLASQSPRRRELLTQIGYEFTVVDVDVPEHRDPAETPEHYVARVAREKAEAGLERVRAAAGAVVLGADTEVVLGDRVFGKPRDADAAAEMLRALSGRAHRVLSAVWCVSAARKEHALSESLVEFAPLREEDIAAYVASGEPFGRAGAYAIQGRAGAFVPRIVGSYSGVMGLPVYETAVLLRRMGVDVGER